MDVAHNPQLRIGPSSVGWSLRRGEVPPNMSLAVERIAAEQHDARAIGGAKRGDVRDHHPRVVERSSADDRALDDADRALRESTRAGEVAPYAVPAMTRSRAPPIESAGI